VPEHPAAGEHHRHVVLVRRVYYFLVPYASAWLYDRCHAFFCISYRQSHAAKKIKDKETYMTTKKETRDTPTSKETK
jgi:hypothetical protein